MTGSGPAGSAESRRGRSPRLWVIPWAAVALAAAVAACSGGAGNGSPAGSATTSGATPTKTSGATAGGWQAKQSQYDAVGTVTYGDELVVTADTGVYAYNRGNGKLLWTVRPPANGAFCGSGQNAVNGKLPVGVGKLTDPGPHSVDCASVGLVDLRSSKLLWTRQIPSAAFLKANVVHNDGVLTEISGNTVMAVWNGSGPSMGAGFSAADGRRLWKQGYQDQFRDLAVANGTFYGLFWALLPLPGQAPMALDGVSPASGDIVSRLHLTGRMTRTGPPERGAIVSTSPMTLLIKDQGGEHEKASFVVLDPARRHIARVIPAGPQSGRPALDTVESGPDVDSHPYYRAVVGAGRLIAVSYPAGGELVAYDLSTGARVWSASQQDVKMISPVAVDGSTVIAAGSTRTGEATLVRVDLTSGKVLSSTPRPVGRGPLDVLIVYYHFTWDDGRAYAVDWRQSVNGSGFPELFTMAPPG